MYNRNFHTGQLTEYISPKSIDRLASNTNLLMDQLLELISAKSNGGLMSPFFHGTASVSINGVPSRLVLENRRVRKQLVNVPSYIVRLDSQKHIDFSLRSPYGGGRPGRVKRKNMHKVPTKDAAGGDDDEEGDE